VASYFVILITDSVSFSTVRSPYQVSDMYCTVKPYGPLSHDWVVPFS
jgi:hypothetical protein